MVPSLLSPVSSMWLNKNMFQIKNQSVVVVVSYPNGVVAQSVEPWTPKKIGIGGRAWVRVPPTP